VDIVSFHFVVGTYESGGHHGMVDRLVIRECLCFCLMQPPGADLGPEKLSQLNYIIDTYLFVAASALAASTVVRR